MRRAKVESGVIVAVGNFDENNIPEFAADWPVVTDAAPGWAWDGATATPPDPAAVLAEDRAEMVPEKRFLFEAMKMLDLAGEPVANPASGAWATVKSALMAADEATFDEWQNKTKIERLHPLVAGIQAAAGAIANIAVTDEAMDRVFMMAMGLQLQEQGG